tara:strand:+ start:745 stop:1071 length:327 start_codon:yes stop_codon:yes gene_type:complete
MAVTWSVSDLDRDTTQGSLSDVVTSVHWIAQDSETVDSNTYIGSAYGQVVLGAANASSFTTYASITQANAIAWAKAALGSDEVTAIESNIAKSITEQKTPATKTGVPW